MSLSTRSSCSPRLRQRSSFRRKWKTRCCVRTFVCRDRIVSEVERLRELSGLTPWWETMTPGGWSDASIWTSRPGWSPPTPAVSGFALASSRQRSASQPDRRWCAAPSLTHDSQAETTCFLSTQNTQSHMIAPWISQHPAVIKDRTSLCILDVPATTYTAICNNLIMSNYIR